MADFNPVGSFAAGYEFGRGIRERRDRAKLNEHINTLVGMADAEARDAITERQERIGAPTAAVPPAMRGAAPAAAPAALPAPTPSAATPAALPAPPRAPAAPSASASALPTPAAATPSALPVAPAPAAEALPVAPAAPAAPAAPEAVQAAPTRVSKLASLYGELSGIIRGAGLNPAETDAVYKRMNSVGDRMAVVGMGEALANWGNPRAEAALLAMNEAMNPDGQTQVKFLPGEDAYAVWDLNNPDAGAARITKEALAQGITLAEAGELNLIAHDQTVQKAGTERLRAESQASSADTQQRAVALQEEIKPQQMALEGFANETGRINALSQADFRNRSLDQRQEEFEADNALAVKQLELDQAKYDETLRLGREKIGAIMQTYGLNVDDSAMVQTMVALEQLSDAQRSFATEWVKGPDGKADPNQPTKVREYTANEMLALAANNARIKIARGEPTSVFEELSLIQAGSIGAMQKPTK